MGNVLSLFSGAGGAVEAFKQAGHNVVAAVDKDEYCIETLRENHDGVNVIQCDLSEITPKEFATKYAIEKDNIDIVVGGPPCQGFSNSGNMDIDDVRNTLVFTFAEYVNYFDPTHFLMENVIGMLSFEDIVSDLLSSFEGYEVRKEVHNAKEYGVPQKRRRVIVIGSKTSTDIEQPDCDTITVGEAFSGLPELDSGESATAVFNHRAPNHKEKTVERIQQTDQGEAMYDSWNDDIRLDEDDVAPTLKAKNFQFSHPTENRGITVRERARLQTFPDKYKFCGTLTAQRRQVGNAVPVKMVAEIAKQL